MQILHGIAGFFAGAIVAPVAYGASGAVADFCFSKPRAKVVARIVAMVPTCFALTTQLPRSHFTTGVHMSVLFSTVMTATLLGQELKNAKDERIKSCFFTAVLAASAVSYAFGPFVGTTLGSAFAIAML